MPAKDKKKQAKPSRPAPAEQNIIGSFRLTAQTAAILRSFWKPLGGILAVYLLVNLLFASGLATVTGGGNIEDTSGALDSLGALVIGGGEAQANPAMQSVFFVVFSLAVIWSLRQLLNGKDVKVKQAYYHSAAPLVPFVIIMLLIIIQLLPLMIGSLLAGAVVGVLESGLVSNIMVAVIFGLLASLSIYLLTSSVPALYAATLPDMQPRQALRSAKKLVRGRRLTVIRRLLFLPLLLLFITTVILLPVILWAAPAAPAVFYILGGITALFAHTYLFGLYRSLLP